MLDDAARQALAEATGDQLVFDDTADQPAGLEPGDVVVSAPTEAAPEGLLRRVTEVDVTADGVEVATEAAAITDAVASGAVSVRQTLSADQVIAVETQTAGVSVQGAGADTQRLSAGSAQDGPDGLQFPLDGVVLYDADGDSATTADQLTADGTVTLDLDLETDLVVRNRGLLDPYVDYFRAEAIAAEASDIAVTARTGLDLGDAEGVDLAEVRFAPITVTIGPVPVVFNPVLTVSAGAHGQISVENAVVHSPADPAGLRRRIPRRRRVARHPRLGAVHLRPHPVRAQRPGRSQRRRQPQFGRADL